MDFAALPSPAWTPRRSPIACSRPRMIAPRCRCSPRRSRDSTSPRAYDVLFAIGDRRRARGWKPVGWKIGFTNRTLWPRYDVWQPMWAPVWDRTLHLASEGTAQLDLDVARAAPHRDRGRVLLPRRPAGDRRRAHGARAHRMDRGGVRDRAEPLRGLAVRGGGLHRRLRSARRACRRRARSCSTTPSADRLSTALTDADVTLRRGDDVVDTGRVIGRARQPGALARPPLALASTTQGIAALVAGDIDHDGHDHRRVARHCRRDVVLRLRRLGDRRPHADVRPRPPETYALAWRRELRRQTLRADLEQGHRLGDATEPVSAEAAIADRSS